MGLSVLASPVTPGLVMGDAAGTIRLMATGTWGLGGSAGVQIASAAPGQLTDVNVGVGGLSQLVRMETRAGQKKTGAGAELQVQGSLVIGSDGTVGVAGPFKPSDGVTLGGAIWAVTGAPLVGLGSNGDIALRSDGGALTTVYQKRAGAWVGIV